MTEDFIQENEDRELFRRIKQGSEEAFRVKNFLNGTPTNKVN